MANRRASGGLIGKTNKTSGGGNTVTRFNSSGTFQVQPNTNIVDVLTVAGGGGGGGSLVGPGPLVPGIPAMDAGAAGGGAGGYRTFTGESVIPGAAITVTVGAGGSGEEAVLGGQGTPGGNSVFSNPLNPISTTGGGGGGGRNLAPYSSWVGLPGGSGGGGGTGGPCTPAPSPGAGNAGSYDPVEGYAGGYGGGYRGGAGGGGASVAGQNRMAPGHGGDGRASSITGTATYYAGGGGGGARADNQSVGLGGLGGGGRGGGGQFGTPPYSPDTYTDYTVTGITGTSNTGGGGGGAGTALAPSPTYGGKGASGGSGVVIVKELDKAGGMFDMKSHYTAHTKGQWPTVNVDDISNSLMFNGGAEDVYLTRVPGSATDQINWTFSCWVKYTGPFEERPIFNAQATADLSSGDPQFSLFFHSGGTLRIWTNSGAGSAYTARLFRDVGAWYHIVLESSSATPYYHLYINGEENTTWSYDQRTTSPGGSNTYVNSANPHFLGAWRNGSVQSPGMYLADVHLVDGQSLHPGHFGEPDPDCPQIWRPKKYHGTYGTNGCHLEFKNSAVGAGAANTIGADTSGNSNHWTTSALAVTDQSTDTPTNNFCTLNPLDQGTITLSEGNTKIVCDASNNDGCRGTMGFPASGKWYFEFYLSAHAGGTPPQLLGIAKGNADIDTWVSGGEYIVYEIDSGKKRIDSSQSVYGATATTGDTIGVAVNMDDNEVIFYKNGSTQGTISNEINTDDYYLPYIMDGSSARSHVTYANFGNPAFSISSGNADGNGYGNFEHAVPNGHYALCTKNLAQYG